MATKHLDSSRPTHLLGIGGVEDVWRAVEFSIDSFDCVSPIRIARHGWAMVNNKDEKFKMNLKNAKHINDDRVIDKDCGCSTCKSGYSRGYLNHLIKGRELLVMNLLTIHNVYFMNNMMRVIRQSIIDGDYLEVRKKWIGE
jgi:queuine tRNA-ribosyltransferase